MNPIPWPYRGLAIAAVAAALFIFGWVKGSEHVQVQWDAATAAQQLAAAHTQVRQAEASVQVVRHFSPRVTTWLLPKVPLQGWKQFTR